MTWHQVSITTSPEMAPKISDFLSELGAVSVTFTDAQDEPIYEPKLGETKVWSKTIVTGLFEIDAVPELIKTAFFSQFPELLENDWQQQVLEDQVWERAWMEHYQPMKFADKLWVCPTDQQQHEENTVCMLLDPGLAFGTGTHPTTALCLEWLASFDLQNKVIIDYGCGSGILAIAALLLGAKKAYAVDIDPQALEATQANAKKNSVNEKIQCFLPEEFTAFQADVVIANILAKPLIDLTENISALVKKNGYLILSGVLNEQANSVSESYQTYFSMKTIKKQQDWCRLVGIKN